MDFGALPPEINSARMYAGPGSGSMAAAALGWEDLAAELRSAAGSYKSVISGLTTGRWLGPSSLAMASAFGPYVAWTVGAAARAEESASQARDAAEVFEAAYGMTVPPSAVTANRVQLASLTATNFLGQNSPAIAANEAEYVEMWAQDAVAMYQYAANSAETSQLTQFTPAPEVTDPAGTTLQTAAVSETTSGSQQSTLSTLMSQVSSALQSLATPTSTSAATSTGDTLTTPWGTVLGGSTSTSSGLSLSSFMSNFEDNLPAILPGYMMVAATPLYALSSVLGMAQTLQGMGTAAVAGAAGAAEQAAEGAAEALGSGVLGTMGNAAALGPLSIPQAWAGVIPAAHLTSAGIELPNAGAGAGHLPPSLLGGLPRAGTSGPQAPGPRYGQIPTVMAQPPSAGYGSSII